MTKPIDGEHTVTICHNGRGITVDYAGALNHARVHPEDIVPAFEDFPGPFPGQNIGESCSLATTTTTLPTPTSTTTIVATTVPTSTATSVVTTIAPSSTTVLTSTPTPTLVTTTVAPPTSGASTATSAEPSPTSAQVVVPSPVVRETLPVTGIGTPGMIVVASCLVAAGVGLVRKARRAA